MRPAVSVLMPVRNGGRFLAPALDSILAQTGLAFEVVVVDDGSTDDTAAVLAGYATTHTRLMVVAGEGRGLSRALNLGLAECRGRYVARMDADDVALPGRLERQFRHLEAHPELGVLGTQAIAVDQHDRRGRLLRVPVGTARVRHALDVSAPLIHPSVMMRRDLVTAAGGYRSLFDGAEDYDLWLRLSRLAALDNLPEPLLLYRRHSGQQSVRLALQQARLAALALAAHRQVERLGRDPVGGAATLREALAALGPAQAREVRQVAASRLVDNGGALTPWGARYFRRACRTGATKGSPEVRRRLALAAVRQQLQLARAARWGEALRAVPVDMARWRTHLLRAYFRHVSILWGARG